MRNEIRSYTWDMEGCELCYSIQRRYIKKILIFEIPTPWKAYKSYGYERPKNIEKELRKYSKLLDAKIMPFGSGE